MLLSIIIPFLNEQETIGEVLQQVTSTVIEWYNFEIILVNDGSDDQSVNIIQDFIAQYTWDYKIQLINFAKNSGKWFALKAWIAKCEWDLILIQDADMEYTPRDYAPLISHLNKNKLDFVYGSRTLGIKKFANHYSNKVFFNLFLDQVQCKGSGPVGQDLWTRTCGRKRSVRRGSRPSTRPLALPAAARRTRARRSSR